MKIEATVVVRRVAPRWLALAGLVPALAGLSAVGLPGDAQACGGLFCNAPPADPFAPLPVAQNGENVVFAITHDPAGGAPTMEAHIQILYTGDADKFSWVVPVDAAPTLGTGSDRLFTALATATQPRFGASYETSGNCLPDYPQPPVFGGTGTSTGAAGTGTTGAAGSGNPGGVQVSFQGAVGPFDAAVIKSDDPTALKLWLTDNGYIVTDGAAGLIDDYVRENKYFVALKLLNGKDVRSIQPITLTFRGTEACVPLRLTAIAANPDMPVLVWVLGATRVAPRAFYEMKIDDARIDWLSNGSNYFGPQGLVSKAANEVGGNAFVTEYAGPASIAGATVYFEGQFNLAALRAAMTPPVFVQQLIAMGLGNDPLTLPLLAKYIPMPAAVKAMGITESQFYQNLATYWAQYAFPAIDLAALANEIEATIITPRIAAQKMIDAHTYLTRLNTFLSPAEMTKDPFFFESQDLPDLSNVHTATFRTMCGERQYMQCNAPVRLELPDGRMAWVRGGSTDKACSYRPYDLSNLATLPAAESAWEREVLGEGNQVVSNSTKITTALKAHNANFPIEEWYFGSNNTGVAGAGGGGPGASDGCGCGVLGGAAGGSSLFVLGGALVALLARRRAGSVRR